MGGSVTQASSAAEGQGVGMQLRWDERLVGGSLRMLSRGSCRGSLFEMVSDGPPSLGAAPRGPCAYAWAAATGATPG